MISVLEGLHEFISPLTVSDIGVQAGYVGKIVAVLERQLHIVVVEFLAHHGSTKGLITFNGDTDTMLGIDPA